jgi:hypothetical protein
LKPLPPTKPTEKLPVVIHLTVVKNPERGDRFFAVVATETQGDEIRRRKVVSIEEGLSQALDEFNRVSTRVYYFGENPITESV